MSRESWLEFQEELCDTMKGWCLHSGTMVTREGQGITGGGEETPLSAVRPCGMGVPPSEALAMSGSPLLTNPKPTKDWIWRLGILSWLAKVRG